MTDGEAKIVAEVVSRADGGCVVCAEILAEDLAAKLPYHDWKRLVQEARRWDDNG